MTRALTLAERGWGRVHPNPLVGAVVVRDGTVVGEGWHAEHGASHAEAMALSAAGDAARGATLYVTLEPCTHQGKQPPCVVAVLEHRVARVVLALEDPDPTAAGGAEALEAQGVEVVRGVLADEAAWQNWRFLHRFHRGARPFVIVKLAVSVDGFIADSAGQSRWISGEAARDWVHRLRANVGAIGVGAHTAIADAPRLTARGTIAPRVAPERVVFDRSARTDASLSLLHDGGVSPIIVVSPRAPAERRERLDSTSATVITADGIDGALTALGARGIDSILVEGGGHLASALLNADLVDRVCMIEAPVWLGQGTRAWPEVNPASVTAARRWRTVSREALGDNTLLVMEH
ncbi:MAG: bifunctional diaminohydroxyphosphoribosylaminopyrimidine deaminase/5-amino-6-(5-phosphoribosylamino)uracil reductase RibD [Gemmatimonadales bacterium]